MRVPCAAAGDPAQAQPERANSTTHSAIATTPQTAAPGKNGLNPSERTTGPSPVPAGAEPRLARLPGGIGSAPPVFIGLRHAFWQRTRDWFHGRLADAYGSHRREGRGSRHLLAPLSGALGGQMSRLPALTPHHREASALGVRHVHPPGRKLATIEFRVSMRPAPIKSRQ